MGTRELTIKTDLRCLKKEYGVRQMSRRIRISPNRRRIVHSSAPWIYRVYMIVCVHVCVGGSHIELRMQLTICMYIHCTSSMFNYVTT